MKLWATLFLAAGLAAPNVALAQAGATAGVQVGPVGVGAAWAPTAWEPTRMWGPWAQTPESASALPARIIRCRCHWYRHRPVCRR